MAKRTQDTTLVWNEIDPATLAPAIKAKYDAYKVAYAKAKEFRAAFETEASKAAALPATHRMVYGYNFGKLSMAIGLATSEKASKKAVAFDTLKAA
jgi:hypothetical protein